MKVIYVARLVLRACAAFIRGRPLFEEIRSSNSVTLVSGHHPGPTIDNISSTLRACAAFIRGRRLLEGGLYSRKYCI